MSARPTYMVGCCILSGFFIKVQCIKHNTSFSTDLFIFVDSLSHPIVGMYNMHLPVGNIHFHLPHPKGIFVLSPLSRLCCFHYKITVSNQQVCFAAELNVIKEQFKTIFVRICPTSSMYEDSIKSLYAA